MFVVNTGTFQVADFMPDEPIKVIVERAEKEANQPLWWQVRISQNRGHVLVLRLTAKQWFSICDATVRNPLLHVMMEAEASVVG